MFNHWHVYLTPMYEAKLHSTLKALAKKDNGLGLHGVLVKFFLNLWIVISKEYT